MVSARGSDTHSRRAMEDLCRAYWYPLYAHARSRGLAPEDAEDLTQTFFIQMLARDTMHRVSPEGGRLRSYLLGALNNVITQDWRHRSARKRGGGVIAIPLDQAAAEARYARDMTEPSGDPEREFNRRWALALLDAVLAQLSGEFEKAGQAAAFTALSPYLAGRDGGGALPSYSEAAAAMGLSEGTFRMQLFRLRQRYRRLLREEILETVNDPSLADAEIAELFAAVAVRA